jgi:hypothetical protein
MGDQGAEHLANALQHNEVTFLTSLDLPYNYSFIIFTDTHNTAPQKKPNRWSRRRTSCECIAAQWGNIFHLTQLIIQLFIHHFHRHSQHCISTSTELIEMSVYVFVNYSEIVHRKMIKDIEQWIYSPVQFFLLLWLNYIPPFKSLDVVVE